MRQIATFDIGTKSIKAALFNIDGTVLAFEQRLLHAESVDTPKEWACAFEAITRAFHRHISESAQLVIVISGHGPSTVYLSAHDDVLYYISWQSQKKIPLPHDPSYYLPQVEYIKCHNPEIFSRTALIIPPAEYLSYLLTRRHCVCVPNTSFVPNMWSKKSIKKQAYDEHIFPSPIISGDLIGTAVSEWAKSLRVEKATVVAGGLDYISASLGAGMLDTHNLFLRFGTSVVFNVKSTKSQVNKFLAFSSSDSAITPTFILTKLTARYYNIGVTIPLFDQIYHAMLSYSNITKVPLKQLHSQIKMCDTTIKEFVDTITQDILTTQTAIHHITKRVATNIPYKQRGIVYLSILLTLIQRVAMHASRYSAQHDATTPTIVVSGGHATDTHFMQLLALFLQADIETFSPVYTELYGNFIFGMKTVTHSKDIKDIPSSAIQVSPSTRYTHLT